MALRGMMPRPTGGSHRDHVVLAAIELANELAPGFSGGFVHQPTQDAAERAAIGQRLFASFPESRVPFDASEGHHLADLAASLHQICVRLTERDVASAVPIVNRLLREFPAAPHVSEVPPWSLHYHDDSLRAAAGWQVGCAAAFGSFISSGAWQYLGCCDAERCDRVFLDDTRNRSRRYCSLRCQNRAKVRSYRLRAAAARMASVTASGRM